MSEIYDLNPDSKEHGKILNRCMARHEIADKARASEKPRWNKAEEQFISYMPTSDADKLAEKNYHEHGEPDYYTIMVPYNYAIAMTAHTYWTSVFLSRDPIFQFKARHGEKKEHVDAVETLHDYQIQVGENVTPLFLWLLDAPKYGEGILGVYWQDEYRYMSEIQEVPETVNGQTIEGKTKKERVTRRVRAYHGNKLYNVKPHDFKPDPRVPLARFQDGEFCARDTDVGWNTILRGKADGHYHEKAVEKLRKHRRSQARATQDDRGSDKVDRPTDHEWQIQDDTDDVGFVNLIEIYIELVPKEWGLGKSEYPEKWMFTIAEEKVIIAARPLGYHHDKFPFAVIEHEMDAYASSKRGMFDMTQGLNDTLTWLFNSHMYNVRQTMNNQFVVDPSRVVMKDLQTGKPGWIARAKPQGYGTDMRTAVHQIPISDVTSQHLEQAEIVGQMMQRLTGVTDNVMGMVNPGGRKSATEVRTSSSASVNRMKTQAEYFSAQGWAPLGQMMLQNTQQFYDQEQVFRVAGQISQEQQPEMNIGPADIQGFYDFVPVDGTMPIDRLAQASLWRELFETLLSVEGLAQQFDIMAIFSYIARLSGAKNVDQFRVQAESPEEIQRQRDQGQIVPAGGVGGQGQGTGSGGGGSSRRSNPRGSERSEGRVEGAPEIPGVGPVG